MQHFAPASPRSTVTLKATGPFQCHPQPLSWKLRKWAPKKSRHQKSFLWRLKWSLGKERRQWNDPIPAQSLCIRWSPPCPKKCTRRCVKWRGRWSLMTVVALRRRDVVDCLVVPSSRSICAQFAAERTVGNVLIACEWYAEVYMSIGYTLASMVGHLILKNQISSSFHYAKSSIQPYSYLWNKTADHDLRLVQDYLWCSCFISWLFPSVSHGKSQGCNKTGLIGFETVTTLYMDLQGCTTLFPSRDRSTGGI